MPWRSRLYLSQSSGLYRQSEMTTIFSVLRLFLRGLGSKALPCEEAQWLNFLKKKRQLVGQILRSWATRKHSLENHVLEQSMNFP